MEIAMLKNMLEKNGDMSFYKGFDRSPDMIGVTSLVQIKFLHVDVIGLPLANNEKQYTSA